MNIVVLPYSHIARKRRKKKKIIEDACSTEKLFDLVFSNS